MSDKNKIRELETNRRLSARAVQAAFFVSALKIILGLVLLSFLVFGALFWFGPMGPASPYNRFVTKDSQFYSRFADDCNLFLKQHQDFSKNTNGISGPITDLWIDAHEVIWDQIKVSGQDPSLPKSIRNLNPDKIRLAPNRVWIAIGVSRLGWGIVWEQDEGQTNTWILKTFADGLVKEHYRRIRY